MYLVTGCSRTFVLIARVFSTILDVVINGDIVERANFKQNLKGSRVTRFRM